jgi:beta-lactamase class A
MISHPKTRDGKAQGGFSRKKGRRRWERILLAVAVLTLGILAVNGVLRVFEGVEPVQKADREPVPGVSSVPETRPIGVPDPPDLTLAGFAYESVAAELPAVEPRNVGHVRQSVLERSWASVRISVPGREGAYYALFLKKQGEEWRPVRSVLMEKRNKDLPKDVRTMLEGIPEDLVNPLFPPENAPELPTDPRERAVRLIERSTGREGVWKADRPEGERPFLKVRVRSTEDRDTFTDVFMQGEDLEAVAVGRDLTTAEAPGFPESLLESGVMASPEPAGASPVEITRDGETRLEERGLDEARQAVRGYPGVAGFYAVDLKSGAGYGVRAGETFFSASTIKIPVMVAVYHRIEAGDLSYSDSFTTQEEDWAAGAGWLRWDTPGVPTTVEDCLWLMMTQSDNVATNALVRLVGGPEYVNEVARDLGAKDTELYWKVGSERAAVPALDNRTTPRDLATMLQEISNGEAANEWSTGEMFSLMRQNNLEWWMEAGIPDGVPVANKAGWLDTTYNDAGIVEYEERPYVLVVLTDYGPRKMKEGAKTISEISRSVWLAESGKTVEEYEREQREKAKEKEKKLERDRSKEPSRKERPAEQPSSPKNP